MRWWFSNLAMPYLVKKSESNFLPSVKSSLYHLIKFLVFKNISFSWHCHLQVKASSTPSHQRGQAEAGRLLHRAQDHWGGVPGRHLRRFRDVHGRVLCCYARLLPDLRAEAPAAAWTEPFWGAAVAPSAAAALPRLPLWQRQFQR